ncbi:FYVE, RhoGEF and PH domain-containing protein 5 isoform X2 [Kryptolebias marmoratus]|uniref:FYVE, RhoGEF and PH domain-containing protein 5 isoform X2 n=1 Tax=Kryptolebias marmoratus TaxID=37003 RepID=UPI0007F88F4B|nr:FYVE, RhoGEF and PH domain-containing protein 5 isoform X2 [Kryptolebias marmoratus]
MNTDCTQPSVAPKPRFVCHASLKLPSPLLSAARGPKPSVAPKPKVTLLLNGNQGGFGNGSVVTLNGGLDEQCETQNGLNKGVITTLPGEKQFKGNTLESPNTDLKMVSKGSLERWVTEDKEDEDAVQKMDEDWRLTDSTLTEEADSMKKTPWVSDDRLTADSEEMIDTDVTEDMDAEGCDAGEALADTEGLSVGDISVNSADEAQWYSAANQDAKKGDGSTADDLSESSVDELGILVKGSTQDTDAKHTFRTESEEEDKKKGRIEDWRENCFYDFIPDNQKQDTTKRHYALEFDRAHEPFYVCSEDIINSDQKLESSLSILTGKYEETAENGQIEDSLDYGSTDEIESDDGRENKMRTGQKRASVQTEKDKTYQSKDSLNHLDCEPRFKQVTITVPTDTDTSLTSSLSESQLLSPNDSDIFRDEDDLEGCIVPYLDETTDTEPDISEEHVYDEPGKVSRVGNVFPFDNKAIGIRSHSMSHRITNAVEDRGVQFLQKTYMSGFGQPTLSSSPMLSSTRHRSYSKPQYLSLYPRSLSMEGQDTPLCIYRDGSQRPKDAMFSSESFSRCSPLSSSALSTPTSLVDIPPPFELSYITKKPITKSSPSLFTGADLAEKNRKKKSSIKCFLMLKFGRKSEHKPAVEGKPPSSKSSAESSCRSPSRRLDLDRQSISSSPQLNSRSISKLHISPEPASTLLLYNDSRSRGNSVAFLNRSVVRVESFEDRSRVPFVALPLTKPRSISVPNTDTSDYENVPPISSDYENVQVPQRRPVPQAPFTDFFDRPSRIMSSANETDGYVDMSSLPGFEKKTQLTEETESAYTEAYKVCTVAAGPQIASVANGRAETLCEEDQGRTSEEEDGATDMNYDRQPDGRSRAFYIVKELVDTERLHVKGLKLLQKDFREAVGAAVGDDGQPVLDDERLREILNELPDVYSLHRKILTELETRVRLWEDGQRIADIFLTRRAEFLVFTTYIGHYDRSISLLEDSCRTSPAFAAIVQKFEEKSPDGDRVSFKQQLLQVIVRVAQYRMILTDYLNNLSPDSKEYEDTQAAVAVVSDIADQVNDSLKHGENLLRLINIAYSVRGQRGLLHPGRVFVKEGTLMKVSRKSRQPRHLFLMNDVLLYTYPQQDGKYRLKNTLPLTGLKVSKPSVQNVQHALKIEGTDISIILSASSFLEREDWFYTLNRTVTEHTRGSGALSSCSGEARDRLGLSLGEKAPTLVPVSQVMMCMNCTADFSLTLRRHHCHSCGRIVCRSCSRNRYPLKYMKDRMAKVCDHCYNELKKRGGDVSALSGNSSPRVARSSRPLSTVFQNIHPPNIWRHRKGTASFTQVTVSEEGSISGTLQRSKKSKKNWKRLWFLLKDKEKVAAESLPLLGFTVKLTDKQGGDEAANVFQLYHQNTLYYSFKAEDNFTAQRWANAMEEATNL